MSQKIISSKIIQFGLFNIVINLYYVETTHLRL